jgi:hypothetical protein
MTTRRLPLLVAFSLLFAGCAAGGAAPTPSPLPSATPAAPDSAAPATDGPDEPVGTDAGGGGDPGNPGPGAGDATVVFPRPGTLNPRLVGIAELEAEVDGRQVIIKASWWSGVEPCNVLDSVGVEREGTTFTIGLREGTGDPNAICTEQALLKATLVNLGELEPGTYTVQAAGEGEAEPITVTVG